MKSRLEYGCRNLDCILGKGAISELTPIDLINDIVRLDAALRNRGKFGL